MGTATSKILKTIHATGRGTDYFGACECCGRSDGAEVHVLQRHRVYVRLDGLRYLSPLGGGAYGHAQCLTSKFGEALDKRALARAGKLVVAPEA